MKFLKLYFNQHKKIIIAFVIFAAIFLLSFALYQIPVAAVAYPTVLCAFIGLIFMFFDVKKAKRKHDDLTTLQYFMDSIIDNFPQCETVDDVDYQSLIKLLDEEQKCRTTQMNIKYSDMMDYYTIWAHQIKTPIASIKLTLQNEDSQLSHVVADDLFRIEQYVEMVLMFLRLDSDYTDYVIKQYDLDNIVKDAVKKFAAQFIKRKINLNYNELDIHVLTDEKWLSFVIEQVLSNALKYTQKGSISIYLESPKNLCIKDTGIGIAPEDLPRIFDKGYTGYNGRTDKKASGIGLYLCKRICNNLGHEISAESSLDKGTTVRINLNKKDLHVE